MTPSAILDAPTSATTSAPVNTSLSANLRATANLLAQGPGLTERVFLLDLRLRSFGTAKKAPVGLIQTDADKTRVRLGKKILDCPEMDAIKAHLLATRRYVESVMIPTGDQFRSGMYLLPYTLLERVEARLQTAEAELGTLVSAFIDAYPSRIEDDREALKSLFDERNYPDNAAVRDAFVMEFKYVCLATPQGLRQFSPEVFERETAKLRARIEEAAEESITLLAEEAKKLAASVVDRLTPSEDGKVKVFRDSLLGNWNEFLDVFADRNITNDADLTSLMDSVKAKIAGRSGDDLRKSAEVREDIRKAFEQVAGGLDAMITAKPVRRIRLSDVEED